MRLASTFWLALATSCPGWAGDCPVPGPRIQWQADYCMFVVESDDIVAADPCMRSDSKRHYRNDCEAKKYYKRQICRRIAKAQDRSEEDCVKDPSTMGPTVRNNGVGG